ncbi:MAG: M20/M25/M40 family metallo-hydrolase [Promethearchaeota archaeon]|nr:MAG: M20/M25/M40 family metallo-hydrolase [Candidatus Lokiarchaeota archaeon]
MEKANSVKKITELIRNSNDEFIENELRPFLRIPSNTLNSEGIFKAKDFLLSYISDFCEEIKEFKGEINPLILAKVDGVIEKSLLIYMMYDTQPINNEKEWISNPFAAEVHILPPPLDVLGDCIIARGAYNSKTPLLCFLNVVKELKKKDELPISLLLLFDGEEEIGSLGLLRFLEENKNIFKDCVDVYYPAVKQDLNGNSVLKLGYKGILSITIKVTSQNKEPHSAFSAMVPNPAVDLVSLINTIFSNNVYQIECLNKAYEISEDDQLLIDTLMRTIDFEKIKEKAGILKTRERVPKKAFINYLFGPTFNISTLKSGFLEEGSKNYIPNEAMCNVDIRFAHDISVNALFQEIKEKINIFSKGTQSEIELIRNVGYESSRVNKESILVKTIIESTKKLDIQTVIWPISAAAAPLSMIQRKLGLNFIVGGLGIGGYAHAPNEFIQYDSIINTRLANYHFIRIYSKSNK